MNMIISYTSSQSFTGFFLNSSFPLLPREGAQTNYKPHVSNDRPTDRRHRRPGAKALPTRVTFTLSPTHSQSTAPPDTGGVSLAQALSDTGGTRPTAV
eukprot:scaffold8775_cov129-Isochrysis_galbana.AAC.2